MVESVRKTWVHIEVDTNKQSYLLDLNDLDLDEIEGAVREFIERLEL